MGKSNLSSLFLVLLAYCWKVNGGKDMAKIVGEPGSNTKVEKCTSISTETGDFEKISPSSKYLIFRQDEDDNIGSEDGYTGDEAVNICSKVENLEQAEITNTYDLESLEKYVFSNVWIGLNDRNVSGIFTEANGDNIRFQSFVGMEPNNLEMSERCVMLSPAEGGYLAMVDVGCDSVKAGVLCQFSKLSSCFLQSAEEALSSSVKDKPEVVTLAAGSRFYISTVQKSWDAAFEVCQVNGLQLITLDDDDINQDLAEQVKKHIAERHYIPGTQFWTGGALQTDGSTTGIVWFMGEETIVPATDLVPHQWAKATPDETEPYDQSGSGVEGCLDISFENTELSSTGTYTPLWRASNCFLPKFFICEKLAPGVSLDVIRKIVGNDTDDEVEGRSEVESCGELQVDAVNWEINLTQPTREEDIIKFLIFNVEHDLKSGEVPYELKDEIKWKKPVLDYLVEIVQKAVDPIYVDHGILNVVKIIILAYLNAASNSSNDTGPNPRIFTWENTYIKHLKKCSNITTKLPVSGNGFELGYYGKEGGDIDEIQVPEEDADKIHNLDSSIDMLWYMFSFAVANCYNVPQENKIVFASDFHVIFILDFIHDLREKWTANVETMESFASRGFDFSIAMGDVDFMQSFKNLRYLVSAAYMEKGISDLQLVRPLDMSTIESEKPMARDNSKTGRFNQFQNSVVNY